MKSGGPIQWLQTKDRLNMNKVKQQKPAHSKFEFKILSAYFHNWEAATTCFFSEKKRECWMLLKLRPIAPLVRFARIATLFLLRRKSLYKRNWHLFFMANEALIWSFTSKATAFEVVGSSIWDSLVFLTTFPPSCPMSHIFPCHLHQK